MAVGPFDFSSLVSDDGTADLFSRYLEGLYAPREREAGIQEMEMRSLGSGLPGLPGQVAAYENMRRRFGEDNSLTQALGEAVNLEKDNMRSLINQRQFGMSSAPFKLMNEDQKADAVGRAMAITRAAGLPVDQATIVDYLLKGGTPESLANQYQVDFDAIGPNELVVSEDVLRKQQNANINSLAMGVLDKYIDAGSFDGLSVGSYSAQQVISALKSAKGGSKNIEKNAKIIAAHVLSNIKSSMLANLSDVGTSKEINQALSDAGLSALKQFSAISNTGAYTRAQKIISDAIQDVVRAKGEAIQNLQQKGPGARARLQNIATPPATTSPGVSGGGGGFEWGKYRS